MNDFLITEKLNSFNRYMVECEYITALRLLKSISVLIDTWWNVNNNLYNAGATAITF